jgi:MFS family permease
MPNSESSKFRMSDFGAVLIASCLAMLAVGENSTAIMAALPAMTGSLQLSSLEVEWVVNAYLLTAAVFIILGGDAADRFGARYSSTAGIGLFAFASLIIAIAPAGWAVIGARALQGLGAAFAVAGTLAAVTEASPEARRAEAIGTWTGFLMLGFSIGPLIGGAITHYAGWRFIFWLNVSAMMGAGLILSLHPESKGHPKKSTDWAGVGFLAGFMVPLIIGLQALTHARTTLKAAIAALALAVLAFGGLLWSELRHLHPVVDFRLFSNRNFAVASGLAFLLMFDIMTLLFYYNLFAQSPDGLGLSPIEAGFSLMPLAVALFSFARAAPWLGISIGLRRMLACGSLILVLGCAIAWVSIHEEPRFAMLVLGLSLAGAGLALPYASAPRVGLATLAQTQVGKGSGMLNSCSFLGGTVGITLGGLVFTSAGFSGVLVLLGLSALLAAALSLRLRTS